MKDGAKCENNLCVRNVDCLRYMSKPEMIQSYCDFQVNPVDGYCNYFIKIKDDDVLDPKKIWHLT